ncbi:MAG: DUF4345 family protein [Pseudomonadales bacterium]|nr:DUF4345 family protein [Pseudomonadales bacterium]
MLSKVVLWGTAIIFMGYGLVCFFDPQIPAAYSGLGLNNGDSWVETAAMYGGLQAGLGIFCLVAALRPGYSQAGLLLIICTIGGLASARGISFVLASDPVTSYTYGALGYEALTAILAAVAFFGAGTEAA